MCSAKLYVPISHFYTNGKLKVLTTDLLNKYVSDSFLDLEKIVTGEKHLINDLFMYLCKAKNIDTAIIQYLLDNGASITNSYCVNKAFNAGNMNVVHLLVKNGVDIITSRIMLDAINSADLQLVKLLVEHGADLEDPLIFKILKECKNSELVDYLNEITKDIIKLDIYNENRERYNYSNYIAFRNFMNNPNFVFDSVDKLINAANYDNIRIAKILLNGNFLVDIDAALDVAVASGSLKIFKYIVTNYPHVNKEKALINASKYFTLNIVQYIVETFNISNLTLPLYYAAQRRDIEIVSYLVEKGADPKSIKEYKIILGANNSFKVIKYLINHGASFTNEIIFSCYDLKLVALLLKHRYDNGLAVSDFNISSSSCDYNRLLFMYAKPEQDKLFSPDIVEQLSEIRKLLF